MGTLATPQTCAKRWEDATPDPGSTGSSPPSSTTWSSAPGGAVSTGSTGADLTPSGGSETPRAPSRTATSRSVFGSVILRGICWSRQERSTHALAQALNSSLGPERSSEAGSPCHPSTEDGKRQIVSAPASCSEARPIASSSRPSVTEHLLRLEPLRDLVAVQAGHAHFRQRVPCRCSCTGSGPPPYSLSAPSRPAKITEQLDMDVAPSPGASRITVAARSGRPRSGRAARDRPDATHRPRRYGKACPFSAGRSSMKNTPTSSRNRTGARGSPHPQRSACRACSAGSATAVALCNFRTRRPHRFRLSPLRVQANLGAHGSWPWHLLKAATRLGSLRVGRSAPNASRPEEARERGDGNQSHEAGSQDLRTGPDDAVCSFGIPPSGSASAWYSVTDRV